MVGEKIKELRTKQKLSQRDLAKELNIANGTISMWENNLRTPDLETIKKLSTFFNVPMIYLVEEKEMLNEKQLEQNIEYKTEAHKECLELINKLTESQALKVSGYIEKLLEENSHIKIEEFKGEN